MAAIASTAIFEKIGEDVVSSFVGGTASPLRLKRYHLKFYAAASNDTLDLNNTVDMNINAIKGVMCAAVGGSLVSGGTAIAFSGTALQIEGGAENYETSILVEMK